MKKIIKYFWKELLLSLLIIVMVSLSTIIASFIQADILNALIDFNMDLFIHHIVRLFGVYLIFISLSYLKIRYQSYLTQEIATYLRTKIMEKISMVSYESFQEKSSGTYVSWLTSDIQQIESNGIVPIFELISGVTTALLSLIALSTIHWSLVVLTVVETVLLLQLPKLFNKQLEEETEELSQANENFVSKTTDNLSGYDTVFTLRKFHYMIDKIKKSSMDLGSAKNNYNKVLGKVAISGGIGNVISQVSLFALTGYLALINQVPAGVIITSGGLGSDVFNTISTLGSTLATIKSTEAIFKKHNTLEATDRSLPGQGLDINSGFNLSQVEFSYGERSIFSDLDFTFDLNRKYAIVGASGSGKSTLLNILTGKTSNYEGEVKLSGKEIAQLSYDEIFHNILYVDQSPYIFDDTVRENLCMGDTFSDQQLWEVLESVKMKATIAHLPHQLDTYVGEKGKLLSGGQLQRLSIARGLLQGRNIILFDESTSKLDKKTALSIENMLLENPDITLIMITHHLDEKIEQQLDGVLAL